MDLNATLIGEIITFILFVWFTMRYVWPPLMKVMDERRKQIAEGLLAAEAARKELELAQHQSKEIIAGAKTQAAVIVEQSHQRAASIIEEAKTDAREEGVHLIKLAKGEIEQEKIAAREQLLSQVTGFAIAGAEKILMREVNKQGNEQLVNAVLSEIR